MRKSGILLNISCLPSVYGIGGFGQEFCNHVDFLVDCGCKLWQVLPLTVIGMGNSPYSGISAFAGNPLYIDPDKLFESGYITESERQSAEYLGSPHTVDYDYAAGAKAKLIELAHSRINNSILRNFATSCGEWLSDYAAFMTIKSYNNDRPWWEWDTVLAEHSATAIADFIAQHTQRYEYYICEQYLFHTQWTGAKEYATRRGVEIVGDMPIYVSHDSADVWSNRQLFQLDCHNQPTAVAGVPPDYFSVTGQLWGNPLYDYDAMSKDNYTWFVSRMQRMFELYDICRFDHFRAVAEYWAVPSGAKDARGGKWVKGGGLEMMRAILTGVKGEIIAEDLGIIDDKVTNLRDELSLKGMRVLQFAWDGDDSVHLPHNYTKDCVAYTGTHDNNTLFGWLYEVSQDNKSRLFEYIGAPNGLQGGSSSQQIWACIRAVITSVADYAIIPFQDLLGWGADTRMNIPGAAQDNWRIRIQHSNYAQLDTKKLRNLLIVAKR